MGTTARRAGDNIAQLIKGHGMGSRESRNRTTSKIGDTIRKVLDRVIYDLKLNSGK
jgi:hypothetical protein